MEIDSLAERILSDLSLVFKRDPNVDEFDIIPILDAQNKSPVIHEGHKFALEAWCIKHLFHYAYNKLFEWKEKRYKADISTVLQWSIAVLLINPEIQAVWNLRKEMILSGNLMPKDDLQFSSIVLSRKPKCSEVFAHRKWLLLNLVKTKHITTKIQDCKMEDLIQSEIKLCNVAASKYNNNYYAWSHRSWIMQDLIKMTPELLLKELKSSEEWVVSHVSEHSGFQYRQFLLNRAAGLNNHKSTHLENGLVSCLENHNDSKDCLIQNKKDGKETILDFFKLLCKELELISGLLIMFQGHEALWYHRRYVLHAFKQCNLLHCNSILYSANKTGSNFGPSCKKTKLESNTCQENHLPVYSLEREVSFLQQCKIKSKNDSVQLVLLSKYQKWVSLYLGLNLDSFNN